MLGSLVCYQSLLFYNSAPRAEFDGAAHHRGVEEQGGAVESYRNRKQLIGELLTRIYLFNYLSLYKPRFANTSNIR